MVLPGPIDRAKLADQLRRFTQRKIIHTEKGGRVDVITPAQREIERRTGFAHQTLSDFLARPERARLKTVTTLNGLTTDPRLQVFYHKAGSPVSYVDAPAFSRQSLRDLRTPDNARGFRFIVETSDPEYQGVRSSEWSADMDQLDSLAEVVPGGLDSIVRIVFDVRE